MLTCPNCHAQLEDGSLFCDSCGARIEPPAPETAPAQEAAQAPQTAQAPAVQSIYCSHCGQQTAADSPFCPNCGASMNETQFCLNCGKQVDATVSVCPHCSFKLFDADFCPNCGNPSNPDAMFCKNCGASLKTGAPAAAPGKTSKKKSKKGFVFAGVGAAAVIAVLVIAFVFLGKSSGGSSNYVLYVKDKEIFYNGFSKKDPWQISSRLLDKDFDISDVSPYQLGRMCQLSEDGSLLFFPDKLDDYNSYTLYYRRIDKPKEEAVKVDSDVSSYSLSNDAASVTYLKNGTLYQYNRKKDDKQKIAGDILSYRVSDDGAKIIYLNEDNDLYQTVKGGDREKIDSEISDLCYVSEDLSVIFYIRDDSLYKKEAKGDKEKISSDVYSVVRAYDSGEVYYITAEEEELSLSDYVQDDKKSEDAAMKEPEYPNVGWNDPSRDAKMDAYNLAVEEYYQKEARDYLREMLKEMTIPQTSYTLCYHNGKEESTVSETFVYSSYSTAADTPVITYVAYAPSDDVSIKLSEIEDIYDVQSQVSEALYSSAERYVSVGSASAVLDEEDTQDFCLSADGRTLYYLAEVPEEKNYGELYQVSISSSGELGKPELYDSDVCADYIWFTKDGKLLYFKDMKDSTGELYVAGEKIDYDVYSNSIQYDEDSGRFTYFTDWNSDKRYGTLKTYTNKEPEKIVDDAHSYYVMPNGKILYLYDYSMKRYQGDLYLWNKKEAEKIDDGVVCIIPVY